MGRGPKYKTKRDGLVILDKPVGISSAKAVYRVRMAAGDCKTGHAGTLDPLASGVLVCGLGQGTKWLGSLMGAPKRYLAGVDLSGFSATDDAEGPIDPLPRVEGFAPPLRAKIDETCASIQGWIEQRPPAFSAIQIEGRRAYKMARGGEALELPTRRVWAESVRVLRYDWPALELEVACGKGFYVRSLARELGEMLGTGGYLTSLRRTAVGACTLDRAMPWDRLNEPLLDHDLIPLDEAQALVGPVSPEATERRDP